MTETDRQAVDPVSDHRPHRYRVVQYESDDGPVTVIHDSENEARWLESTVAVEVER
ncbi:hypothetical protein [Halomarina oriensis]|uniref:hypothetical protein n=1 Tax=Halomarina oriensis TaxID=671145 RepID=UPI0018EF01C4|nr:hypothetical protein [Halomarina oriensis]